MVFLVEAMIWSRVDCWEGVRVREFSLASVLAPIDLFGGTLAGVRSASLRTAWALCSARPPKKLFGADRLVLSGSSFSLSIPGGRMVARARGRGVR